MKDYPATTKFLTEPERVEVLARLKRDRSSLADEFAIKYFWSAIKDWKIWVHSTSLSAMTIPMLLHC